MIMRFLVLALVLALAPALACAQTTYTYQQTIQTYTYQQIISSPPALGAGGTITLSGYWVPNDFGRGAVYTNNLGCSSYTSANVQKFPDGSPGPGPYYYCLQLPGGVANVGWFGAKLDAHYTTMNGSIDSSCILSATNISGSLAKGDNLVGDGIPSSSAVTIMAVSAAVGTSATLTLSGCPGESLAPAFHATMAPNTATTSVMTVTMLGMYMTLAPNQVVTNVSGINVAPNTQIISGPSGGGDGIYIVTNGGQNITTAESMTTQLNLESYGGTDDSGALTSAAATGADVLIAGPSPTEPSPTDSEILHTFGDPQMHFVGMLNSFTLPYKRQKLIMRSARFLALPGFVGDYVVVSGDSRQVFDRLMIDGGALIGTQNVGGFQCGSSVTDSIIPYGDIIHYTTIGLDLSASCRAPGVVTAQWNNAIRSLVCSRIGLQLASTTMLQIHKSRGVIPIGTA